MAVIVNIMDVIYIYFFFLRKVVETSVLIVGELVNIRTRDLPITRLEQFCYVSVTDGFC